MQHATKLRKRSTCTGKAYFNAIIIYLFSTART